MIQFDTAQAFALGVSAIAILAIIYIAVNKTIAKGHKRPGEEERFAREAEEYQKQQLIENKRIDEAAAKLEEDKQRQQELKRLDEEERLAKAREEYQKQQLIERKRLDEIDAIERDRQRRGQFQFRDYQQSEPIQEQTRPFFGSALSQAPPEIPLKFGALRFVVGLIKFLAIVTAIGGYVISAMIMAAGIRFSFVAGATTLFGILGIIASTLVGIFIYANADLIQCVIDIEHNSREAANNTNRILANQAKGLSTKVK